MWVAGVFVSYLLLALLIPATWALARVWRRARIVREVRCPEFRASAVLTLDPWYAVKMHVRGDQGLSVRHCSRWSGGCDCGQECLIQIAAV